MPTIFGANGLLQGFIFSQTFVAKSTRDFREIEWSIVKMSKLQREEDEMYEAAYRIEILPDCRTCKHHHGQIYGGVELVCAVHPYGYSGDSCPDYQARKRLLLFE